jgi:type III pantothenate kinase
MSRVLVIDRGNHSVKGALYGDGRIVDRWQSDGTAEDIAGWAADSKPDGAAVSSVVGEWNVLCGKALRNSGIDRILFAAHDSPWPFALDVENPETIGPDRLCAAAAPACEGVTDAVIIDAGTAVTVDILRDGVFTGGAIMPGLDMMLHSLCERTSALPRISMEPGAVTSVPGRDTASALRAGVLGAYRGGAGKLLGHSVERFVNLPPVFLTGGDAGHLIDALSPAPRHYPDLVLQGLNCMYDRQFK